MNQIKQHNKKGYYNNIKSLNLNTEAFNILKDDKFDNDE